MGVWGPIIVSVGNLLTIVLMLISDVSLSLLCRVAVHSLTHILIISPLLPYLIVAVSPVAQSHSESLPKLFTANQSIFGSGLESLTLWSLLGSSVIVIAFGILAYDMFTKHR